MSFLQKREVRTRDRTRCYKAAQAAAFLFFIAGVASGLSGPHAEPGADRAKQYRWPGLNYRPEDTLARRIAPPPGARRVPLASDSFGAWLRDLPLKAGRPPVRLYNGELKRNQSAHFAVIDIDTGARDLQQCADALMRLRSEYLFARGEFTRIRFRYTDESVARYDLWRQGFRPLIRERKKTHWTKRAAPDVTYAGFRAYLEQLFMYAGTYSLSRESTGTSLSAMQVGDFFLQGGFPGHGVMIVDMAESTGVRGTEGENKVRRYYLLTQSYMPAQEMHVLNNPASDSPWYTLELDGGNTGAREKIRTPEWEFTGADLMRFSN